MLGPHGGEAAASRPCAIAGRGPRPAAPESRGAAVLGSDGLLLSNEPFECFTAPDGERVGVVDEDPYPAPFGSRPVACRAFSSSHRTDRAPTTPSSFPREVT